MGPAWPGPDRWWSSRCQAPGFVEALLVGSGGGRLRLFLVVGVGDPGGLVLGRSAHADGAVGAHRVVPVDPFGDGGLDIADALPGAVLIEAGTVADELGLVQGVEDLGQSEAERSPPSTRRMRPPRTGPGSARAAHEAARAVHRLCVTGPVTPGDLGPTPHGMHLVGPEHRAVAPCGRDRSRFAGRHRAGSWHRAAGCGGRRQALGAIPAPRRPGAGPEVRPVVIDERVDDLQRRSHSARGADTRSPCAGSHRSEHPNRALKTYATQAVPQPLTVTTETENAGRVWRTGPYSRQHAENSEHRTINLSPTSSDCSVADCSEAVVEIIQNYAAVYVDLLKDADQCCVFARGLLL